MTSRTQLYVRQGADFTLTVQITDNSGAVVDITGHTISMAAKLDTRASSNLITASTGGGQITLTDPTNGIYKLTLTNATTALLNFHRGVYDILRDDGSVKTRDLEGDIILVRGVA